MQASFFTDPPGFVGQKFDQRGSRCERELRSKNRRLVKSAANKERDEDKGAIIICLNVTCRNIATYHY